MHLLQLNLDSSLNALGLNNCELSKSGISSTLLLIDCFENPICATVKVIILECSGGVFGNGHSQSLR